MIEIAMAIGIIGFALVAIIGILPTGMNSQRDNRADNLINEDANFFMQALRSGSVVSNGVVYGTQFDFLTNYVEGIEVTNTLKQAWDYTNTAAAGSDFQKTTFQGPGAEIIGLLTTPAYYTPDLATFDNSDFPVTNHVRAWMRAINGAALEQNGGNALVAFRYVMDVQITPHTMFAVDTTNYLGYDPATIDYTNRYLRWIEARVINQNLYDVNLTFHWPIVGQGGLGPNHQTFRGTISGCLTNFSSRVGKNRRTFYYFEPNTFTSTNNDLL